jgi:hypothetical protein
MKLEARGTFMGLAAANPDVGRSTPEFMGEGEGAREGNEGDGGSEG